MLFVVITITISASISRGDYYSYYHFFHSIDLHYPEPNVELLFFWMNYWIKYITNNEFYMFFIATSLAMLLKFYALRNLRLLNDLKINYGYYFCLYFSTFLIYLDLGSIRFAIATSFLFVASTYLVANRVRWFYFYILIGILFHASLLPALLIPTLLKGRRSIKFFYICLIIGLVFILSINNSIIVNILSSNFYTSKILGYLRFGGITITFQLVKKIVIFTAFYFILKEEIKNKASYVYICWIVSLFSFSLAALFFISQLTVSRYLLMFGICEPIMLILIFRKVNLSSKYALILLLVIYVATNYGYSIYANSNEINLYLPYKNYLLGDTQPYRSKNILDEMLFH
ncbi:EpsG family protein [Paralysiella testudinis]|uniref:EpsG family protein n=1 Tax=Paralysiella testudinis TaxID=2809020 RepID=A0A892ZJ28_9NEIS|nr:EpsG family protein [Paralysiella testudinis]QRQ82438.1 EpsG family protein [Paralysiella testudinis]